MTIPIPQDWAGCEILADDVEVSDVYQEGSSICFVAHMSAMAGGTVRLRKKGAMDMQGKPISHLENRCLKITFSEENMIEEVLYKPTNRVVMSRVDNLLVAQRDCGSFQVEQPEGTEIPCGIGEFHTKISRIGQTQIAEIEGEFPEADGNVPFLRLDKWRKKGDKCSAAAVASDAVCAAAIGSRTLRQSYFRRSRRR